MDIDLPEYEIFDKTEPNEVHMHNRRFAATSETEICNRSAFTISHPTQNKKQAMKSHIHVNVCCISRLHEIMQPPDAIKRIEKQ